MENPVIPEHLRPYWAAFRAQAGREVDTYFAEACYFDDNEAGAKALADLIVAGTKRATAGLLWEYEHEQSALPRAGSFYIVTDWDGTPRCIVESLAVEVVPFNQVSAEFAAVEGEGDGSLEYWRRVHWDFFSRHCALIGRVASEDMPVVCERFRVVYR